MSSAVGLRVLTTLPAGALPAGALLAGALLAGCGGTGQPAASGGRTGTTASGRVAVVAVENTWGDITRQIGGSRVAVTSILTDPGADPHAFQADPRNAAALGSARFVVENGLGYDDFADKLLLAGGQRGREVVTIATAARAGAGANPHLWYSPAYVTAGARAISAALTRADPAGRGTYRANLAAFLRGYAPYVQVLATIRSRYAGTPVAYTERVPGYLLAAAGLRLAVPASFAQSIEDGTEPSPADTDAMNRALTGHRVKLLFYNAQVTSPTTDRVQHLARDSSVPVVGVSETIPADSKDFSSWQLAQARAVLAALGG